jgi:tetratricopeptide (TPR) repeat protein
LSVLETLESLVGKSLVKQTEARGQPRLVMLETIREYARDRLIAAGEAERLRERHRACYLALAEEAKPKLTGAEQAEWLRRLDQEHDNLRSALEWSLIGPSSRGGLRLCGALQRFWWARGYLSEGRESCMRVLAKKGAQGPTQERAQALKTAGVLAYQQGDYPAARALDEESLAIHRLLGDRRGIAGSLNNLGLVACDQGDFSAARALHQESLAIMRDVGDRKGIANSVNNLGNVAFDQGDFFLSRTLYEESLAIARELGDREGVARVLGNLGNVAKHEGDLSSARALHEESLAIKRELGYRQRIASSLNSLADLDLHQGDLASAQALYREALAIGRELGERLRIAFSLEGLAAVFDLLGRAPRAARIWGAAERLRTESGSPLPPKDRPVYDRRVAAARAALGDDAAFDRAWQEGGALTLEQVIELALEETVERPAAP